MCSCAETLKENLRLTEFIACIVRDIPYEPKFLPKLKIASAKRVDTKCFDVIVQSTENLRGQTNAHVKIDTATGEAYIGDNLLAPKLNETDTIMIGTTRFHVVKIDTDSGEVTMEVIGDQNAPSLIEPQTDYCIYGNAQDLCSFNVKCSTFTAKPHTINIQDIGDCYTHCYHQQKLSEEGAFAESVDISGDNEYSMVNRHVEELDLTAMFGVPSKELKNGTYNYTTGGYLYYIEKFGLVTEIAEGTLLTADHIDTWACDMKDRDIKADCVYINPLDWKYIKKIYKDNCERCTIKAPGDGQNVLGSVQYDSILLEGFDEPLKVMRWNKVPRGYMIPVDTMNVDLVTNTDEFQGGMRFFTRLKDTQCNPKSEKRNFESSIGLKVYDPYRTSLLRFDYTAGKKKAVVVEKGEAVSSSSSNAKAATKSTASIAESTKKVEEKK